MLKDESLPALKKIVMLRGQSEGCVAWKDILIAGQNVSAGEVQRRTEQVKPEDISDLIFTSGTTGKPKGAQHVHYSLLAQYISAKYVLHVRDEDTYWCTADPGWVTGTSYGIIAPLTHGVTSIIDEAEFDAER